MLKDKKVLVTGSRGLIGKELVKLLKEEGAIVYDADKKDSFVFDLTNYQNCLSMLRTYEIEYVFHLMGVKGSPEMTKKRPVDFMVPMLQADTNMIKAAQEMNVKGFLYTSSIALLNLKTDFFPGTAKQTAETLIEAMRVQYPKGTKYCIVRPSSVYGNEDLNREGLMFISKMIKNAQSGDLELWNDGASLRDFIHARDVARAMIQTMKDMPERWRPIGSGKAESLREAAELIAEYSGVKLKLGPPGETDERLMELDWDFKPKISLGEGIAEAVVFHNHQIFKK